jgi:hypothetical protein
MTLMRSKGGKEKDEKQKFFESIVTIDHHTSNLGTKS